MINKAQKPPDNPRKDQSDFIKAKTKKDHEMIVHA